jgi:hypothetical protein
MLSVTPFLAAQSAEAALYAASSPEFTQIVNVPAACAGAIDPKANNAALKRPTPKRLFLISSPYFAQSSTRVDNTVMYLRGRRESIGLPNIF